MDRDSDEECMSDADEEIIASLVGGESPETYSSYELSRSKFKSTVVVRKFEAKGLSFQLWPAANAVCWFLENEFGESGMCLPVTEIGWSSPASVVHEEQLSDQSPSKEMTHLPGVIEESLSKSCSGYYHRPSENRRMKVLELGSGTGLVGIVAACLGAHVILTDLPHVLPNAVYNVERNRSCYLAAGGLMEHQVLRWGVEGDVKQLGDLSSFDLIVASDVVYYDNLYKPLLQTLKWLVGAAGDEAIFPDKRKNERQSHGVKHEENGDSQVRVSDPPTPATTTPFAYGPEKHEIDPAAAHKWASFSARAERRSNENVHVNKKKMQPPVIYLGHMRRWKKDSQFFKQSSKVFNVQVVHRHPPQDNDRVGPIIYRLQVKPNCLTDSDIP
ncbi:hypothetical protein Mapa_017837 [Marchantia paleacea]|nr:hypothetical protein Mapa_017837 [Marchantia paleacea]